MFSVARPSSLFLFSCYSSCTGRSDIHNCITSNGVTVGESRERECVRVCACVCVCVRGCSALLLVAADGGLPACDCCVRGRDELAAVVRFGVAVTVIGDSVVHWYARRFFEDFNELRVRSAVGRFGVLQACRRKFRSEHVRKTCHAPMSPKKHGYNCTVDATEGRARDLDLDHRRRKPQKPQKSKKTARAKS